MPMPCRAPEIRVIAPSSALIPEKRAPILAYCRSIGVKPIFPTYKHHIQRRCAPANVPTQSIFTDIIDALYQTRTPLIWAARGGDGAARLEPFFTRYKALLRNAPPKIIAGYSDITFLLNTLGHYPQFSCIHAPTLSELSGGFDSGLPDISARIRHSIRQHRADAVTVPRENWIRQPLNERANAMQAPMTAPIEGGNLTLIQTSLGTSWQIPRIPGGMLLIEDIDEEIYAAVRTLEHIRQATGNLNGCAGIFLGDMNARYTDEGEKYLSADTDAYINAARRFADACRLPMWSVKSGHAHDNVPIQLCR